MNSCYQPSVSLPNLVCVWTPLMSHHVPTGTDVSMALARSMAPLALTPPAPWTRRLYGNPDPSVTFTLVYSRIALTACGDSAGGDVATATRFAAITIAARPLVTAAAMLVPLR